MSFILRDPFFDGFDDLMEMTYPFGMFRRTPMGVLEDDQTKVHGKKAKADHNGALTKVDTREC